MQLKYCVSFSRSRNDFARARPAAAVEVHRVGRARHVDEQHRVAADRDLALGIARRDVEAGRGELHLFHHKCAIHADPLLAHIHVAAGFLQDTQRLFVQEEDPDFLQDAHRPVMDALDRFLLERLHRAIPVLRNRPRRLMDRGGARALQISRRAPRNDARGAAMNRRKRQAWGLSFGTRRWCKRGSVVARRSNRRITRMLPNPNL